MHLDQKKAIILPAHKISLYKRMPYLDGSKPNWKFIKGKSFIDRARDKVDETPC